VSAPDRDPLLEVTDLRVRFRGSGGAGHEVLSGLSLAVSRGELVGVIGETGSGKTTLGRVIVGLVKPAGGAVALEGRRISGLRRRELRALRRSGAIQLVFQDPLRSLDPEMAVAAIVSEGLAIRGVRDREAQQRAALEALELVGLDPALASRHPGEISGGQRQRVAIARSLALHPKLLICDEPVSALDASNRGYILRLLGRLRVELGIAMLIISHDLVSLAEVVDRVAVLNGGQIVEQGPIDRVFFEPSHPYTELLIASAPQLVRARRSISSTPTAIPVLPASEATRSPVPS
jgi:ABC-type glutathione transport system ATPase component